jgi:hypothetical protein
MFTTVHQFSSLEQHTHIAGATRVWTTLLTVCLMPTAQLPCWCCCTATPADGLAVAVALLQSKCIHACLQAWRVC